jgi:hypothetical protein
MKKPYFLLFLTVLQSFSILVNGQDLQFYREDIVFKVNEEVAVTDACYHFCNIGEKDIRTALFYPFPENTMMLVDSLIITDLKTNQVIPYREGKSGVFFGIFVSAYGQSAYRVYFRQQLAEKKFKYILTSTENWGRSLEFANFELQVPVYLSIDSLSYPPDTSFIKNEIQFYQWKKKDMMPDRDFVVEFH